MVKVSAKSKDIKKSKPASPPKAILKNPFKKFDNIKEPFTPYKTLNDIPATDIDGKKIKRLGDTLKGKELILVINVASKCGLTSANYKFLESIYAKYAKKGLEILAFPCNQFGSQEPGTDEQIKKYAQENRNAKYRLFKKTNVNGPNTDEVFKFLRYNSSELFIPE